MQPQSEPSKKVRFGILLLPKFTLSALSLFLDPIRLAADERDRSQQLRCGWDIVTQLGDPVESSSSVTVQPTAPIGVLASCDYVVVVGGLIPRYWTGRAWLVDLLRKCAGRGQKIVGLCTGAFAVAEAGLLNDRQCSVSWFHKRDFEEIFADLVPDTKSQFCRSGRHFTSAGGLGAAYLAISIIRDEVSEEHARKSASILLIPFEHIGADQPAMSFNGVKSPLVRNAIRFLEETLEEPISMARLSERLKVSRRTLERTFRQTLDRTALDVREELRVRKAKELCTETNMALIDVALACGYQGTGSMNRSFKRQGERLPRDIRASLATRGDAAESEPP